MTLHLVRHGRTLYNEQGRLQGWSDSPLTADGLRGVRATAAHLAGTPFAAAYASPSGRTVATAREILAHHPGMPLTTDPGLREFSFGDFEARPNEELFSQVNGFSMFREVLEGTHEGLPGGEPADVYNARVRGAFGIIEAGHAPGEHVLVVSHGMTLMAYLTWIGWRPAGPPQPLANASVTTVEVRPGGVRTILAVGHDPSGDAGAERGLPHVAEALAAQDMATELAAADRREQP